MQKMFASLSTTAAAALALLLTWLPASAQDTMVGTIKISAPWTRVPPPAAKVAGGFLTLTNTGTQSDRLMGGTALAAGRIEVHEMTMSQGIMTMRELKTGLEIKPGQTVTLQPGSYHIMFLDLKAPLKEGETVRGTLVFERAGTVEIAYRIEPMGAKASGHVGHGK